MISDRTGTLILLVVGAIWSIANVLAMVSAVTGAFEYRPDLETHGIFSLVLTAVFAIKRKESGASDDADPTPKGGEHKR